MVEGGPVTQVTLPSLRRRLYLLAWVDEFGPIYAVYTLWFNDNGVSIPGTA